MKLIIAGSRTFNWFDRDRAVDIDFIDQAIEVLGIPYPKEVVCGCGGVDSTRAERESEDGQLVSDQGIDKLGEYWADANRIPIARFPGQWVSLGKSAGPIRNREMAEYADSLLLIWDGTSRGSASMKREMEKLGKDVYEIILKRP